MAEQNLIKSADLAQVREIEFAYMFQDSIKKLKEALGITHEIKKVSGTVLKAYKAKGDLQDGNVAEGDIIPLSHYKTEPVNFGEVTIKKWRKATSIEGIDEKGYDQAVTMTTNEMLKDVQKGIKKDFFNFLASGTGQATGSTFQMTIAQVWGQLQVLFEDTEIESVYFMNPLDISDYLGTANITVQTAFGLSYIENFLNLGTVIINSSVPKGKIYGTAKDNLVLYYVGVDSNDVSMAFTFTTDELGYIGIHEVPDYDNLTVKDTVACGIYLFAERIDGIVVGTIGGTVTPTITLDRTTATIPIGTTITIIPNVSPAGTAVTWTTSDAAKATVTTDGIVRGIAAGTATITATAGQATATVAVTVDAGA